MKGELGAAASELEAGMPISSKTVQRLACDGTFIDWCTKAGGRS